MPTPRKYDKPMTKKTTVRETEEVAKFAEVVREHFDLAGTPDVYRFLVSVAADQILSGADEIRIDLKKLKYEAPTINVSIHEPPEKDSDA
jgi:hypothetical protein